jgi:hypothetical protein
VRGDNFQIYRSPGQENGSPPRAGGQYAGPGSGGLNDAIHLGGVQVALTLAGGEHRGIKTRLSLKSL